MPDDIHTPTVRGTRLLITPRGERALTILKAATMLALIVVALHFEVAR